MNKLELKQYTDLKREIKLLENKVIKLELEEQKNSYEFIKEANKEIPYTENQIRTHGLEFVYEKRLYRIIRHKKRLLLDLKIQCEELELAIYNYIYSIADSQLRQILIMNFIDGLKQEEIAERMHLDRSVVSRKITKLLGII